MKRKLKFAWALIKAAWYAWKVFNIDTTIFPDRRYFERYPTAILIKIQANEIKDLAADGAHWRYKYAYLMILSAINMNSLP